MRVLGAENFGVMAMAQALIQYIVLFVDYGFNFSATRLISINRNNQEKINKIYTVTIVTKFFLACSALSVFAVIGYLLIDAEYYTLVFWGIGSIIGTVLFPVWLFQGIEKMQGIAIFTVIAKSLSIIMIFVLVNGPADIEYSIFCQSMGIFISGVIACFYVNHFKLGAFTKFKISDIRDSLQVGFDLFISNIAMSFYTTLNILIVGFFGGPVLAGYFAAADKIRTAAQGLLAPVQQALFPRVSALVHEGKKLKDILNAYGMKFIFFGLFLSVSIAILGYPISQLYYGDNYTTASVILLFMSPIPFIVSIGVVYGQWWLIPNNQTKVIRKTYLMMSIIHIISAIAFMYITPAYGIAISIITTESLVSFAFIRSANKCERIT